MVAKFTFFLVLTLCSLQVTIAEETDEVSIQEILKIIQDLSKEIQDIIKDLSKRLPQIIKNLESSIQGISSNVDISEIFENLKNKISTLMNDGNSAAVKCVKSGQNKIKKLSKETEADITTCVQQSQNKSVEVQDQIKVLMVGATKFSNEIANRIQGCVADNKETTIGLAECLKSEVEGISEAMDGLKGEIKNTIDIVEEIALDTSKVLAECMTNVEDISTKKADDLIASVQTCISNAEL